MMQLDLVGNVILRVKHAEAMHFCCYAGII
jgi:hypothetical protein